MAFDGLNLSTYSCTETSGFPNTQYCDKVQLQPEQSEIVFSMNHPLCITHKGKGEEPCQPDVSVAFTNRSHTSKGWHSPNTGTS